MDEDTHTLVAAASAAIKIDGLNEYGRIWWTNCSAYCPSSGVLEFQGTLVQTASGVPFNAGAGFRVAGVAPSGNYLRGNGTNFVSSTIQPNDLPDASATQRGAVSTGTQTFAGSKTFVSAITAQGGIDSSGQGVNAGSLAINGTTIVDSSRNISTDGYVNTSVGYRVSGVSGETVTISYKKPDDSTGQFVFTKGILTSHS